MSPRWPAKDRACFLTTWKTLFMVHTWDTYPILHASWWAFMTLGSLFSYSPTLEKKSLPRWIGGVETHVEVPRGEPRGKDLFVACSCFGARPGRPVDACRDTLATWELHCTADSLSVLLGIVNARSQTNIFAIKSQTIFSIPFLVGDALLVQAENSDILVLLLSVPLSFNDLMLCWLNMWKRSKGRTRYCGRVSPIVILSQIAFLFLIRK